MNLDGSLYEVGLFFFFYSLEGISWGRLGGGGGGEFIGFGGKLCMLTPETMNHTCADTI